MSFKDVLDQNRWLTNSDASAIAYEFERQQERIDELEQRISDVNDAALYDRSQLEERIDALERRIDALERRLSRKSLNIGGESIKIAGESSKNGGGE